MKALNILKFTFLHNKKFMGNILPVTFRSNFYMIFLTVAFLANGDHENYFI